MVVSEGFLVYTPRGQFLGTVQSWRDSVPQPFKTRAHAEKYSYLGQVVAARVVVEVECARNA